MPQEFLSSQKSIESNWLPEEAWQKPFLRIGHGGASGHAPANTLRSLRLALQMGVDMVEFDVRPCRDALVLLHDDSLTHYGAPDKLASQSTIDDLRSLAANPDEQIGTLAEALDLLKGHALINVDIKAMGYEDAVVKMVMAKGMAKDVIYSSLYPQSLRRISQAQPEAMIGISYPEDRRSGKGKSPYPRLVVNTALGVMRLLLPFRILQLMAEAQANAVMLYHKVVSKSVVKVVHRAGGKVFVWTVDTPQRIREVKDLGVDGITSNLPNLFDGIV